jgi:predicted dehydrogenase
MSGRGRSSDSRVLRVGILGAGWMGGVHARCLSRVPRARVTAVCSRPLSTAEELAAGLAEPRPRVFVDLRTMLDATPLDALYICLPPFAHNGQLELAASRGIHVFVEKPIALSEARARSMADAARSAGIVTQVGYHMRFGGAVRRLAAMIEDGTAGRPTLFDGRYECNALHGPWWRDRRRSGGQVFEQAIHLYNLAAYFLGKPVTVCGFAANLCHRATEGYTVEDTSAAAIRFASGALATICASNCAVPGRWNGPCTVVCERLTAHFTSCTEATFIHTAGRRRTVRVADTRDPYLEEDAAFVRAARAGRASPVDVAVGLADIRTVSGVLASSRQNGAPVRLR